MDVVLLQALQLDNIFFEIFLLPLPRFCGVLLFARRAPLVTRYTSHHGVLRMLWPCGFCCCHRGFSRGLALAAVDTLRNVTLVQTPLATQVRQTLSRQPENFQQRRVLMYALYKTLHVPVEGAG